MARIQILPDQLVSQIAAGEVVERPASVVKELLENALDAGASRLEVDLEAGGKGRVRVKDDGSGMGKDDALLAFDRHATSKIRSFDDLQRVASLGFRGEALASIAAVSRVELVTAEEAGEGYRVRIEGGRIKAAEPAPHPRGTTVDVQSLFFNVPVRRKFLKRPQTELRRCLEVVQGYALAWPEVGFVVRHEGRELLEVTPAPPDAEGLRSRVAQIFGTSLADHLTPFETASADGRQRIHGLLGDRETARGRRLFVYVNRRLLRDRSILAVFYRAVRETWRSDDFPALFLFLDLAPEEVDVNVHPQKAEVRFREPRILDRLDQVLRRGLERALGEEAAPLRPAAGAPRTPLAWQGLGGRPFPESTGTWRTAGEVREGGGDLLPPGRLATAVYAPLERPPVPLSGRSGEVRPFRLLGQYKGTLILLEGPDGLYLVDQHVAHERILYEELRRALAGERPPSQAFLDPSLLELSRSEALRLEELAETLDRFGFVLRRLSGNTLALAAAPTLLKAEEAEKLLVALASEEREGDGASGPLEERLLNALAASMACRSAVKMHHPLSPEEMEGLISRLFAAEQPYACPHGRPIVLKMSDADLERRFGRR